MNKIVLIVLAILVTMAIGCKKERDVYSELIINISGGEDANKSY